MKLLALLGYPRKNGHTARLAELFLKGAESAGAEIQREDLPNLDVRPCIGCFNCWTKTPGKCVQEDDTDRLLTRFLDTDLVFVASPVYAFSVSSYVKHFMERTLTILSPGAELSETGIERNRWRYPGRGPKRMAALLLAGRKTPDIVQPTITMLELWAEEMRMHCSGILVRAESCALRFPRANPLRTKAILTGCERAGHDFVTKPNISKALQDDVSAPVLADLSYFTRYSRVFWEYAREEGDECDAAGLAAGNDVRILIYEMARNISSTATHDVTATIQFDFPDQNLVYAIMIKNGTCSVQETSIPAPDLRIRCPASLWSAVVQRTIAGTQLLTHPDLQLEGDLQLFRRLPRYFPPPIN
jgi:putative NADPH-quinone reductase